MNLKAVMQALSERYGLETDRQRETMLSRVKQLQRMGWPKSTNAGRGSRDNWTDDALEDLMIVTELRAIGLPAQLAVAVAKEHLRDLKAAYREHSSVTLRPTPFDHRATKSALVLDFSE